MHSNPSKEHQDHRICTSEDEPHRVSPSGQTIHQSPHEGELDGEGENFVQIPYVNFTYISGQYDQVEPFQAQDKHCRRSSSSQSLNVSEKTANGTSMSVPPKAGDIVAGKFSEDGE